MKVLVTGGAGFIGSHLMHALAQLGASVIVIDNLSTGHREKLTSCSSVDLIEGDAGDETLLSQVVPGCEWVFHQAAVASVPDSVARPLETHRHNVDTTLKLLIAARDARVQRFLFASSSAIYGLEGASPKRESDPPAPTTPYGLQKYTGERYGQLFHQLYRLPVVALRYFNVFGPQQSFNSPYSGVIARFCTAMLRGEAPTIYGDGLQSRDFIYISNVIRANLLAAQAPANQVAGRVFNVGTGNSITLNKLVADINDLTGQHLTARHEPARQGDILHSEADISQIQRTLGFTLECSWKEGLAKTLDDYRRLQTDPMA